jgi:DNA replication protein DnaC
MMATSKQANCPMHGDYQSEPIGKFGGWSRCPTCDQDLVKEIEATKTQTANDLATERILARLEASGIPLRFQDRTLSSYRATSEGQRKALTFAMDYVGSWTNVRSTGRSALWIGSPGTGKTHLAIGVCLALLDKNQTVLYTTVQRAIRRIRDTWSSETRSETEAQAIKALATCDLLVLDEVGVQAGSTSEQNLLFDVINERYNNRLPTLLLSNLTQAEVVAVLGERVIDRLREDGGKVITFDWQSARKNNG